MDIDWTKLKGGYGVPYDPRSAIEKLRQSPLRQEVWEELWDALHHQGDLGEASYAAVPLLVEACSTGPRDWNFYALLATIDVERHRVSNPELPAWMATAYSDALKQAKMLALRDLASTTDKLLLQSALSVVALAAGGRELGALLAHLESSEIGALLDDWVSWRELYRRGPA